MDFIVTALLTIASVVAIASLVAAITPTPVDDGWLKKLYSSLEVLALNIWRAKDK